MILLFILLCYSRSSHEILEKIEKYHKQIYVSTSRYRIYKLTYSNYIVESIDEDDTEFRNTDSISNINDDILDAFNSNALSFFMNVSPEYIYQIFINNILEDFVHSHKIKYGDYLDIDTHSQEIYFFICKHSMYNRYHSNSSLLNKFFNHMRVAEYLILRRLGYEFRLCRYFDPHYFDLVHSFNYKYRDIDSDSIKKYIRLFKNSYENTGTFFDIYTEDCLFYYKDQDIRNYFGEPKGFLVKTKPEALGSQTLKNNSAMVENATTGNIGPRSYSLSLLKDNSSCKFLFNNLQCACQSNFCKLYKKNKVQLIHKLPENNSENREDGNIQKKEEPPQDVSNDENNIDKTTETEDISQDKIKPREVLLDKENESNLVTETKTKEMSTNSQSNKIMLSENINLKKKTSQEVNVKKSILKNHKKENCTFGVFSTQHFILNSKENYPPRKKRSLENKPDGNLEKYKNSNMLINNNTQHINRDNESFGKNASGLNLNDSQNKDVFIVCDQNSTREHDSSFNLNAFEYNKERKKKFKRPRKKKRLRHEKKLTYLQNLNVTLMQEATQVESLDAVSASTESTKETSPGNSLSSDLNNSAGTMTLSEDINPLNNSSREDIQTDQEATSKESSSSSSSTTDEEHAENKKSKTRYLVGESINLTITNESSAIKDPANDYWRNKPPSVEYEDMETNGDNCIEIRELNSEEEIPFFAASNHEKDVYTNDLISPSTSGSQSFLDKEKQQICSHSNSSLSSDYETDEKELHNAFANKHLEDIELLGHHNTEKHFSTNNDTHERTYQNDTSVKEDEDIKTNNELVTENTNSTSYKRTLSSTENESEFIGTKKKIRFEDEKVSSHSFIQAEGSLQSDTSSNSDAMNDYEEDQLFEKGDSSEGCEVMISKVFINERETNEYKSLTKHVNSACFTLSGASESKDDSQSSTTVETNSSEYVLPEASTDFMVDESPEIPSVSLSDPKKYETNKKFYSFASTSLSGSSCVTQGGANSLADDLSLDFEDDRVPSISNQKIFEAKEEISDKQ